MSDESEAAALIGRVRARFPRLAAHTDRWLEERGWSPSEVSHIWLEAFADRTSEAVKAQDWTAVVEQTKFFAAEHRNGTEGAKRLIDVAYAENLMWDLSVEARVAAWPHIASEIQQLYAQMWGAPELPNEV